MKLFAGSSCQKLAGKIGVLGKIDLSGFPNGENKVFIQEDCEGQEVYVMQNFCSPVDQNIIQFCLMVDAVKRLHPKKITGIIPWLGYAKQNKVFRKGESLAAEVVARIVSSSGVDEVILLDVHSENIKSFFSVPVKELSATDLFVDYILRERNLDPRLRGDDRMDGYIVVSPDAGALNRNKYVAEKIKLPLFVIDKQRDLETGKISIRGIKESMNSNLNSKFKIQNSSVLMFDDMILSGGTLVEDAKYIKNLKAKDIYFFATHLNVSSKTASNAARAYANLSQAEVKKIVVTNSLEFDIPEELVYKIDKLDLTGLFVNGIRK